MPIQTTMRNGRKMYRWGDSGKEYPTKEQAERQGRAIEASKHSKEKKSK